MSIALDKSKEMGSSALDKTKEVGSSALDKTKAIGEDVSNSEYLAKAKAYGASAFGKLPDNVQGFVKAPTVDKFKEDPTLWFHALTLLSAVQHPGRTAMQLAAQEAVAKATQEATAANGGICPKSIPSPANTGAAAATTLSIKDLAMQNAAKQAGFGNVDPKIMRTVVDNVDPKEMMKMCQMVQKMGLV